jgi:hypothetical protein
MHISENGLQFSVAIIAMLAANLSRHIELSSRITVSRDSEDFAAFTILAPEATAPAVQLQSFMYRSKARYLSH